MYSLFVVRGERSLFYFAERYNRVNRQRQLGVVLVVLTAALHLSTLLVATIFQDGIVQSTWCGWSMLLLSFVNLCNIW